MRHHNLQSCGIFRRASEAPSPSIAHLDRLPQSSAPTALGLAFRRLPAALVPRPRSQQRVARTVRRLWRSEAPQMQPPQTQALSDVAATKVLLEPPPTPGPSDLGAPNSGPPQAAAEGKAPTPTPNVAAEVLSIDAAPPASALVAGPLRTLQEVREWARDHSGVSARENVANVALSEAETRYTRRQRLGPNTASELNADNVAVGTNVTSGHRPRLLVCHDMQGGYQDDRWLRGGSNAGAYRIWHWRLIDIFVYFSHHLVTIPPAGWTNVAHRHGVKVLGTFITEWDEGAAICREILSTIESAQHFADQLVAIAAHHRFDGWLLNIENEIKPDQIPTLIRFVRYLTERMHASQPGAEVIWYDSVTTKGTLEWQDGLTPLNEPFFAAADGLFVNYTWKKEAPEECAQKANHRAADVFMGIDVFGRGSFGGGQYNVDKALLAARAAGVSAALFAPGWVFENPGEAGADFEHAQEKFWGLVQDSWPAARTVVRTLPFESDFNQGVGFSLHSDGVLVSEHPWNNLSLQSLQPLHHHALVRSMQRGTLLEAKISFEHAFQGGSSYEIHGTLENDDFAAVPLFDCSVELPPDRTLAASFTVLELLNCHVALVFRICSTNSRTVTAVCNPVPHLGDSLEWQEAQSLNEHQGNTFKQPVFSSPQINVDAASLAEKRGSQTPQTNVDLGLSFEESGDRNLYRGNDLGNFTEHAGVGSPHTEELLWADQLSLTENSNGWRTFEFELDLESGSGGLLTGIGVVGHKGSNMALKHQLLGGLWDSMERNVEDAWIHREIEAQSSVEKDEGKEGRIGVGSMDVGVEKPSVMDHIEDGWRDSNPSAEFDPRDSDTETSEPAREQSSGVASLGRKMLLTEQILSREGGRSENALDASDLGTKRTDSNHEGEIRAWGTAKRSSHFGVCIGRVAVQLA